MNCVARRIVQFPGSYTLFFFIQTSKKFGSYCNVKHQKYWVVLQCLHISLIRYISETRLKHTVIKVLTVFLLHAGHSTPAAGIMVSEELAEIAIRPRQIFIVIPKLVIFCEGRLMYIFMALTNFVL